MKNPTLILLILLTVFAANSAFADSTGTITGTIVDKETGIPIPGAKVAIDGDSLICNTDQRGIFVINDLPAGILNLKANSIGYHDAWINDISLSSGGKLNVLFHLLNSTLHEPYDTTMYNHGVGIIKGTVLNNQNNLPIGSAILKIKYSNIEVQTDSVNGKFVIRNILPGKYELEVTHPAFMKQSKIISVKATAIKTAKFNLSNK
jgi:hypothetical protein